MNRKNKNLHHYKAKPFSSYEDAKSAVVEWHEDAYLIDPYDVPEVSEQQMERLLNLVCKTWEDAYELGRKDVATQHEIE